MTHPVDKIIIQPVCMTDDEFAVRTEPEKGGSKFRVFVKEGLDNEYKIDFDTRLFANVRLYGREITKEEYNKWVKPF